VFAGIGVVGYGADLCSLAREGHLRFAASPDLLAQANLHLSLTAKEAVGYTRGRGFSYIEAEDSWDCPSDLMW
jgi:hypothetical protein